MAQLLGTDGLAAPAATAVLSMLLEETGADAYALFSITKLMTHHLHNSTVAAEAGGGNSDRELVEMAIGRGFKQSVATAAVPLSTDIAYPLKSKLCMLANRVYLETLLFDGERISLNHKARRYVELVCLFLDLAMLSEVLALRLTCKSNHENRRFPVYYSVYRELEANLIEGWVGHDACRFVSTSQLHQVIVIHNRTTKLSR